MTIRTAILSAGVLATAVLFATAHAEVKASDRAQISKGYKLAAAAMHKMDMRELSKGMTNDFSFTQNGQTGNKADTTRTILDTWTRLGMMRKFNAGFIPAKFTQKGKNVLVNCIYSFSGTSVDSVDGSKIHHMSDTGTCVDIWTKVNGHWMLKAISVKTDTMTMDHSGSWPGWPTNPWR